MITRQRKHDGAEIVNPGRSLGQAISAPSGLKQHGYRWPLLLLAGYLLFAHGCHGDEDNELFSANVGQEIPAGVIQAALGSRWASEAVHLGSM